MQFNFTIISAFNYIQDSNTSPNQSLLSSCNELGIFIFKFNKKYLNIKILILKTEFMYRTFQVNKWFYLLDLEIFENRAPGFRRQPITYDYHNLRVAATQGTFKVKFYKIVI